MLDNYDSFTYNLVQYLGELGAEVRRRCATTARASMSCWAAAIERCVVSPGPCTPEQAGITLELVRRMPEAGIPTLGVCLGHQALAQAFGGALEAARAGPRQGHDASSTTGARSSRGLSSPLTVGRYHSLVVDAELPDCLEETARGGGVLMGVRHRELPAEGVQFHPESVLTEQGRELLRTSWAADAQRDPDHVRSTRSRRGRDLSAEQTAEVLAEIMHGEVSETQIAGFLIALRTKGETVEELAGLARTMRALAAHVPSERDGPARHRRHGRRAQHASTSPRPPR